jgi:hypothetical protein
MSEVDSAKPRRWLLLLPRSRIQKPRTDTINVSLPVPCLAMPCRCEQNAVIEHLSYSLSCQKLQSGSGSSSSKSPRTVLYNPTVCHAHRTQMRYQTPSNAAKRPSRGPTFHSSLPFHASPFPSFIHPAQHTFFKTASARPQGAWGFWTCSWRRGRARAATCGCTCRGRGRVRPWAPCDG